MALQLKTVAVVVVVVVECREMFKLCDEGRRYTQNPTVEWHVEANNFHGNSKNTNMGEQENVVVVVVVGSKKEKKTKE